MAGAKNEELRSGSNCILKSLILILIIVSPVTFANDGEATRAAGYYHFMVGVLSSLDNDARGALENYQIASQVDPQNSFLTLRQVEELLNLSQTSEAKKLLEQVKNKETKNPEYHVLAARVAAQAQDLTSAVKSLETAGNLYQDYDNQLKAREMLLTKVAMLADNRDYANAVQSLEKYLKSEPDDEISHYFLGKIHTIFQNRTLAKKAYQKSLELRPGFLAAAKALGLQLELEGKIEDAVIVYNRALRSNATDEELLQKLINLSLINDNYEEALQYLRQYLLLRPDDLQNQMRAGLIHFRLKQYDSAKEIFLQVLSQEGTDKDRILFYLGSLFQETEDTPNSFKYFGQLSSSSEYFVESRLQMIQTQVYKLNNFEEAVQTAQTAIKQRPESAELVMALAGLYEFEKKYSEAVALLEKEMSRFEDNEKMAFLLGSLLDKQGDFEGSIKVMRKIISNNMNNAHALNHIGYAYAERGINLDEAESLLKRAIQIAPENGFIADSLGWTYFRMGKYKQALDFLSRANKLSPNQPVILEHLADTHQKMGSKKQALEVYKKILSMRASSAEDAKQKEVQDSETQGVQARVKEKVALLGSNQPN